MLPVLDRNASLFHDARFGTKDWENRSGLRTRWSAPGNVLSSQMPGRLLPINLSDGSKPIFFHDGPEFLGNGIQLVG
jgi:hypothetical protein